MRILYIFVVSNDPRSSAGRQHGLKNRKQRKDGYWAMKEQEQNTKEAIREKVRELCAAAKQAAPAGALASTAQKQEALRAMRRRLLEEENAVLAENKKDLERAQAEGMRTSMQDRLRLTSERIRAMAEALGNLARFPDPVGQGECSVRPNGLLIRRIHVPIGVVAMIYEARPNVTVDAAGLCLMSGNAAVLRGGKEALLSNLALVRCLKTGLTEAGLPDGLLQFIDITDRESASALMEMRGLVDVLIPRGSAGLIRSVTEQAKVPVIETGAGNCHLYVDESADRNMACSVAMNAKAQRPSVCNAIETLLVHRAAAADFLPLLAEEASKIPVELRGCVRTQSIIRCTPATEEDFETEYNDYILAVKVVDSLTEAVAHINRYGTKHSEAIITESMENARLFQNQVDAAAVYVNASTRFTDGEVFGYGAEIGISTQKLHARGPLGLSDLTTVKFLIDGNGQIR